MPAGGRTKINPRNPFPGASARTPLFEVGRHPPTVPLTFLDHRIAGSAHLVNPAGRPEIVYSRHRFARAAKNFSAAIPRWPPPRPFLSKARPVGKIAGSTRFNVRAGPGGSWAVAPSHFPR